MITILLSGMCLVVQNQWTNMESQTDHDNSTTGQLEKNYGNMLNGKNSKEHEQQAEMGIYLAGGSTFVFSK